MPTNQNEKCTKSMSTIVQQCRPFPHSIIFLILIFGGCHQNEAKTFLSLLSLKYRVFWYGFLSFRMYSVLDKWYDTIFYWGLVFFSVITLFQVQPKADISSGIPPIKSSLFLCWNLLWRIKTVKLERVWYLITDIIVWGPVEVESPTNRFRKVATEKLSVHHSVSQH